MPKVLRFAGPRNVKLIEQSSPLITTNFVKVRTIVSGISAGTEMSAYRGTNPYLHGVWDPETHLFDTTDTQKLAYPLDGWGYSEVGEVLEIGTLTPEWEDSVHVGDRVWGIWGHREEGVVPIERVAWHQLPSNVDPAIGTFNRVAAVALNAVLSSEATIGTTLAIVGQGVIGLLATRFATMAGAKVIAVESVPLRQEKALAMGAAEVLSPSDNLAHSIRADAGTRGGLDAAIELSGTYGGLQSSLSLVGPEAVVVAAGFYQGSGALTLGTEFHHNRIDLRCSQIGAVARNRAARWTRDRLHRTAGELLLANTLQVESLITNRFSFTNAAEAYDLVDTSPLEILQVVMEMQ